MKPGLIRFSQRPTTATAMAPTITYKADIPKEQIRLAHKIRKPLVEKMRRDRINNCIEELKALLGPQMLNQQPDSKMEKADILEMTVCLLRRHLQSQRATVSANAVSWGFSRCAKEAARFLSEEPCRPAAREKLILHIQALCNSRQEQRTEDTNCHLGSPVQSPSSKDKKPAESSPWRPW